MSAHRPLALNFTIARWKAKHAIGRAAVVARTAAGKPLFADAPARVNTGLKVCGGPLAPGNSQVGFTQ